MKKTAFSIAMLIAMTCAAPAFAKGGVAGGGGRAVSVSPARVSAPVARPAPAKPVAPPAPASTSKVLTPAEASVIRARNASSTPAATPYVAPVHTPARSTGSNKCDEEKAARNECKR